MKIQLDVNALTKLIESDEEFAVELKRGVLSQVIRKVYEKDAHAILEDMVPTALKELKKNGKLAEEAKYVLNKEAENQVKWYRAQYNWRGEWKLKPATAKKLKEAVAPVIEEFRKTFMKESMDRIEAAQKRTLAQIDKQIDQMLEGYDATIEKYVSDKLNAEITRRVDAKFKAVLRKANA